MNVWMAVWQMVLIAVILVYGLVAVRVAIGGIGDIKSMLSRIDANHREAKEREANVMKKH